MVEAAGERVVQAWAAAWRRCRCDRASAAPGRVGRPGANCGDALRRWLERQGRAYALALASDHGHLDRRGASRGRRAPRRRRRFVVAGTDGMIDLLSVVSTPLLKEEGCGRSGGDGLRGVTYGDEC